MGHDNQWHTRWSDDVRTMYHINQYRWPLVPRIRRMMMKMKGPGNQAAKAATAQQS